jgi:fructokinase
LRQETKNTIEKIGNKNGKLFGGIEAGGTKFVCGIGTGPDNIEEKSFPTRTPTETLNQAIEFFREYSNKQQLVAIGIASFGFLDLNPSSSTFGFITSTAKLGWSYTDIFGTIKSALNVPVAIDTDVNGAALGEYRFGNAKNIDNFIYLTIGTGIGGGGMINGKLMHGLLHPEMGHVYIPHDREKDNFEGLCPFHKDCFEGLASGPAISGRWRKSAHELPEDHPAWDLEAHYIALALTNYICILSPKRIILGGGVMERSIMLPLIQEKVQKRLENFVILSEIAENIDNYIVKPKLGKRAGVLGAIVLAEEKIKRAELRKPHGDPYNTNLGFRRNL